MRVSVFQMILAVLAVAVWEWFGLVYLSGPLTWNMVVGIWGHPPDWALDAFLFKGKVVTVTLWSGVAGFILFWLLSRVPAIRKGGVLQLGAVLLSIIGLLGGIYGKTSGPGYLLLTGTLFLSVRWYLPAIPQYAQTRRLVGITAMVLLVVGLPLEMHPAMHNRILPPPRPW